MSPMTGIAPATGGWVSSQAASVVHRYYSSIAVRIGRLNLPAISIANRQQTRTWGVATVRWVSSPSKRRRDLCIREAVAIRILAWNLPDIAIVAATELELIRVVAWVGWVGPVQ